VVWPGKVICQTGIITDDEKAFAIRIQPACAKQVPVFWSNKIVNGFSAQFIGMGADNAFGLVQKQGDTLRLGWNRQINHDFLER